jgi:hypothetical protein
MPSAGLIHEEPMVTHQDSNGRTAEHRPAEEARAGGPPPHPLDSLAAHLGELREHANHYAQATADRFKLTLRQAAIRAVLGCLALLVGATLLITAAVMLLSGIAGGIGTLLAGHMWAGELITGLTLLLGVAAAAWWGMRRLTDSSRRKTIEKYERRHHEQLSHCHERFRHGRPL